MRSRGASRVRYRPRGGLARRRIAASRVHRRPSGARLWGCMPMRDGAGGRTGVGHFCRRVPYAKPLSRQCDSGRRGVVWGGPRGLDGAPGRRLTTTSNRLYRRTAEANRYRREGNCCDQDWQHRNIRTNRHIADSDLGRTIRPYRPGPAGAFDRINTAARSIMKPRYTR
jgi:hypothetical protein